MKLTEFLSPADVHYGVSVSSKKRLLESIGKFAAHRLNLPAEQAAETQCCPVECFNQLFKREKLGTTALNNGIALPHAKLPFTVSVEQPIAFFLQLETAIDYDADDHKEIDLVYAILFPESCCEEYKSELRQLVERLSDKNLLKQLRAAASAEDLWQILSQADQHVEQQIIQALTQEHLIEGEQDGISHH